MNDKVITPYQKAQQAWDERLGSAHAQAKTWRITAFGTLALCLGLLAALLISLNNHKAKLYIAQINQHGEMIQLAPVKKHYQINQAEKEYFITHFIQLIRSLPLDPVLAKKQWLQAYQFLTARAATQVNHYMQQHNPLTQLGKQTISVSINDINPLSDNSYQIDWTEQTINKTGEIQSTKQYSGIFSIIIKAPDTEKMMLSNPLGLYITDFNLTTRDNMP